MKKIHFVCIAALSSLCGFCQPVATMAHVPQTMNCESFIADATNFSAGSPGVNVTWNFRTRSTK